MNRDKGLEIGYRKCDTLFCRDLGNLCFILGNLRQAPL